jgi:hypothetical protein
MMRNRLVIRILTAAVLLGLLAAPVALLAAPQLALSIDSGPVGTGVTISGSGYDAYSDIHFYYDGSLVKVSSTDETGRFSYTYSIPPGFYGGHTIKADDVGGHSATAVFSILQRLVLSTYEGYVGDTVLLTGTGFDANKGITVIYNSAAITTFPTLTVTDVMGNFSTGFLIPPLEGPAGATLVEVSDGVHGAVANIVVAADTTISPETSQDSPGYVGMALTVNGFGYTPLASVTITYGSDNVELAVATTAADGTFTANITIPASSAGSHTITVSDSTTTRQFAFWIEGEAPPAPSLLAPPPGATVDEPVGFHWQDVNDPSGASYTLQVAADSGFSTLLVNQAGLPGPSHSLGAILSSDSDSFYWRVKAIDGAGNEGDWSTAASFSVSSGAATSWIKYLLYGLGGLVVLALGLWLVRRRGARGGGSTFAF